MLVDEVSAAICIALHYQKEEIARNTHHENTANNHDFQQNLMFHLSSALELLFMLHKSVIKILQSDVVGEWQIR